MKSFFALCLAVSFVFCSATKGYCADNQDAISSVVHRNQEYGFSYLEETDNESVTRTYICDRSASSGRNVDPSSNEMVRAVLLDLGLSERTVSKYTSDDIDEFSNAERITSTTTYKYTDSNGVVSFISEAEAKAIAVTESSRSLYNPDYIEEADYSCIELTLVVFDYHNGEYRSCVQAEWLTMPSQRFTDSIGLMVEHMTLYTDTYAGWYEYTMTETNHIVYSQNSTIIDHDFASSDMRIVSAGDWDGMITTFSLPNDVYHYIMGTVLYTSVVYSGFSAYLEFESKITHDNLSTSFNVAGCYDHATVSLDPSASIGIGTSGGDFYLGFSVEPDSIPYPVITQYPIEYEP